MLQKEIDAQEGVEKIEKPEAYAGWRVVPDYIEFWKGRSSRLHDRLAFQCVDSTWKVQRLQP